MDATPVWLMRQAGRYLEGYQRLREAHSFLELIRTPEWAAEISLEPVRRFEIDAAIVFADILLPLEPMGLEVTFDTGGAPEVRRPIRSRADLVELRPVEVEADLGYVLETLALLRSLLRGSIPLIGFAGAPFTLLSYAVEGGTHRDVPILKAMMWRDPDLFEDLMGRMSRVTADYLSAQVRAGAQAVQIFDSWVGALAPEDYRRHVLPHTRWVVERVREAGAPVIHFAPLTGAYLELVGEAGADVVSLDWRSDLAEARRRLGPGVALQGNLDPLYLKEGDSGGIREAVRGILDRAGSGPGHIFNLGHGVLPGTPPANVAALVDAVHALSQS